MFYKTRRLIHIIAVMTYYGLDQLILPKWFSPSQLLNLIPHCRHVLQKPSGDRIFLAFSALGPLFIKFGQLLSIRSDLLDADIIKPLEKLQDQVNPFDGQIAIKTIEKSFKKTLKDLYETFDPIPLASASVAQVHKATLYNGDAVVVKIIRPSIKKLINTDIKLLYALARCFSILSRSLHYPSIKELLDEYRYTITHELNLMREASNYTQMQHYFEKDQRLYVPHIYWSHTNEHIMTVEQVHGVPIDEIHNYPHVDKKQLAYNGVNIFFTQVFKHRFFHADMHPGNVLIDITIPHQAKYVAIDFGITGVLSPTDQYYIAENFLAIFHRDYTRVAQLHIEAQWVGANTNITHFESAIRSVCEPIFSQPIEAISIADIMRQIITISREFELQMQPQLLLLQKTLFHIEALGRQLYPQLNLWEAASPFLRDYMKQRTHPKTGFEHLKKELPRILTHAPQLPFLLNQRLQPQTQITTKQRPRLPAFIGIIIGLILGTALNQAACLTAISFIYILLTILIIMILWKCIK